VRFDDVLSTRVFNASFEAHLSQAGASPGQAFGDLIQIRQFLTKCERALTGLADFISNFVKRLNVESAAPYTAFMHVIDRDARDAVAAVRLVLAQPSISSQLVDNLNASIHLRALLTDLFLIDEVFKAHRRS